jgi:hypothetical protein
VLALVIVLLVAELKAGDCSTGGRFRFESGPFRKRNDMDEWLKLLRRPEDALARFYVAHKQAECKGEGCELCREFMNGVRGGIMIHRKPENPSDFWVADEPSWMKILEEAGYAKTVTAPK